ncbi:MAG: sialate O-acetylesterase [Acidobacteria bacterium]|nr:sialate O-acetylesterase [Acidobacteriota bacterium]
MAGRGAVEEQDKTPIPGVFMLTKELTWAPAVDPMHFDRPTIIGTGLGRSFARELLRARPGTRIGLIPAAFGGSALDEWQPGTNHFKNAVARARAAMKNGQLRGILWHQGEADSADESKARSYRQRFAVMLSALRAELGAGLPVVAGQLGEFLRDREGNPSPFSGVVNEQLATLPLHLDRVAFASSASLGHKGDVVHFDSPGLRELGRRYALAFRSLDPAW